MKNRILVTGGCGYLGARLCQYLAEKGHYITVFCHQKPFTCEEWASLMTEIVVGDIRDEDIISKLAEKEYDVLIHLISLDHRKSEDNPDFVSSINVMPTWNLLDKFSKIGLKKFIYFSTTQVYGKIPNRVITEEYAPDPQNTYGLTHLLSEEICNFFDRTTQTKCVNLRLSNGYGNPVFKENNCWWLVINDFCKMAFENNEICILSDGSPQRDFINITDICIMVQKFVEIDDNNLTGNTFNLASGTTLTILELAYLVKKSYWEKYKKPISIKLANNLLLDDVQQIKENSKYQFDIGKIKNINFTTSVTLDSGISELFDYLEKTV